MKWFLAGAFALGLMVAGGPGHAYDTLEADFEACVKGGADVPAAQIVEACTRLIDNSQAENETVGLFYAIRASLHTDRGQNCRDARKASELVKAENLQANLKSLRDDNC